MLTVVETFRRQIQQIDGEDRAVEVLRAVGERLGGRGALLIEYAADLQSATRVLDTDASRGRACIDYFAGTAQPRDAQGLRDLLALGRPVAFDARDLDPRQSWTRFALQHDLTDGIAVPITRTGAPAGLVIFSGARADRLSEDALVFICYALFVELGRLKQATAGNASPLTRRETQVMQLSAEGLTSTEIADRLGISPRTVNQHVDNVVVKLGTRNRAHSIAKLLREAVLQ